MVDMLPFPRITGNTPAEQIGEILNYLIQFKETLEFALVNISTENLSPDLVNKLNELGANIEQSQAERESELAQISRGNLTVSDVLNSEGFKVELKNEVSNIKFTVNFESGHLEYNTSNEEVNDG